MRLKILCLATQEVSGPKHIKELRSEDDGTRTRNHRIDSPVNGQFRPSFTAHRTMSPVRVACRKGLGKFSLKCFGRSIDVGGALGTMPSPVGPDAGLPLRSHENRRTANCWPGFQNACTPIRRRYSGGRNARPVSQAAGLGPAALFIWGQVWLRRRVRTAAAG
jgi:hypothetical protein